MHYRSYVSACFLCYSFLISSALFARADECSDILQQGIFDQYKISSKNEYQAKVKEFFSKTWEQLKQEHSSSHGGGSFDFFDIFSLGGEGGSAEDKFNQQSKYEANRDDFFSSSNIFEFESKIVNSSVVDAWKHARTGRR
jgi:hypothetical protein